ncbi:G-protein coupled receptor [Dermatophagoides pteronyssinus]|uniref:G-protein coupled receptor n=1 Tax=Dermatophagoides pteronyssinus TaxID=6956 RepID=A0ABQ8J6X4_DERPT|nr:G-protein coupled receptor [Dermatophagoides pteronyssinus]
MEISFNQSDINIFNLFKLLLMINANESNIIVSSSSLAAADDNHTATTTINDTRFIRSFSYFTDTQHQTTTITNLTKDCYHLSSSSSSNQLKSFTTTTNNNDNYNYIEELLKEKFNNATVIISVIILVLINIMVIFGNILVILSVFTSQKLRTVTNFFIVSLAVADFLVGIAVLPYSLTFETRGYLVKFGVKDVLNLCAISVDRYLAVTRPVRYRSLMTAKRAKFIIACVWIISFIICFPPLLLGKQESFSTIQQPNINITTTTTASSSSSSNDSLTYQFSSSSIPTNFSLSSPSTPSLSSNSSTWFSATTTSVTNEKEPSSSFVLGANNHESPKTEDYLSSTINNQNFSTTTANKINERNSSSDFETSYLKQQQQQQHCKPQTVQCALFRNKSYVIYSALGSFFIPMFVMIILYWKIYLVAIRTSRALKKGYRITKASCEENQERLTLRIHRGYCGGGSVQEDSLHEKRSSIDHHHDQQQQQHCQRTSWTTSYNRQSKTIETALTTSTNDNPTTINNNNNTVIITNKLLSPPNRMIIRNGNGDNNNNRHHHHSSSHSHTSSIQSGSSPSSSREGSARSNKLITTTTTTIPSRQLSHPSKRSTKYQAKRFHAETKAAKTVGIIVGGFIVCWLPFFIVYLTRAFCVDCIPDLLFSIFFWLGYCNSMINPCIYGLFSRDFRRAFKNIICRCRFREETSVSSLIRQIHMPTFFEDMPEEMVKHESQEY